MVMNAKPTGRALSIPAGLACGGLFSLGTTLAGAAVEAKLLEGELLAQEHIGYGVMVILVLSSLVGGLVSAGRIKRQRGIMCLLSGGIYFALLLGITALFFGARYSGVGETGLMILCGSILAAMMSLAPGHRAKRPKAKVRNR